MRRKKRQTGWGKYVWGGAAIVLAAGFVWIGVAAVSVWNTARKQATEAVVRQKLAGPGGQVSRGEEARAFQESTSDEWVKFDDGKRFAFELPGKVDFVTSSIMLFGDATKFDRWNTVLVDKQFVASIGTIRDWSGKPIDATINVFKEALLKKGRITKETSVTLHDSAGGEVIGIDLELERANGGWLLSRLVGRDGELYIVEFNSPTAESSGEMIQRVMDSVRFYPPLTRDELEAEEIASVEPAETEFFRKSRLEQERVQARQDAESAQFFASRGVPDPRAQDKAREEENRRSSLREQIESGRAAEDYQKDSMVPFTGIPIPDKTLPKGLIVQVTGNDLFYFPATVMADRGEDIVVRVNGSTKMKAYRREQVFMPPDIVPQPVEFSME